MKKYNISIDGMHCASCGANVERSLKKVQGVKNVSVSVLMKRGTVEGEDSVKADQIKEAVSKTGYKVTSIN